MKHLWGRGTLRIKKQQCLRVCGPLLPWNITFFHMCHCQSFIIWYLIPVLGHGSIFWVGVSIATICFLLQAISNLWWDGWIIPYSIPIMRTGVLCFHFASLTCQGKGKGKGPKGPAQPAWSKTRQIQAVCLKNGRFKAKLWQLHMGKILEVIVDSRPWDRVFP